MMLAMSKDKINGARSNALSTHRKGDILALEICRPFDTPTNTEPNRVVCDHDEGL